MPVSYHLSCKIDIAVKLVYVDASIDPALARLGLLVNKRWDGFSNTLLTMNLCREEQLYHPSEAWLMLPRITDEKSSTFYTALNSWLDTIRV